MEKVPAPPNKPVAVTATVGPNRPQATIVSSRPPAFKIRQVAQRSRYLKLLIYGNYGVGKTYLAGTASLVDPMQDVLMINVEAGDLTLDEFDHIDEISVTDFKTLARVYEFLKAHCTARDAGDMTKLKELQQRLFEGEPSENPRQYRTVIIDSLSEVNEYCLNQLLGVEDSTKLDEDPVAAEFKEYKQNHTMMLRFVRSFRNLPMHVIFTCAESYVQDETKRQHFAPALTGKLGKQIQGFMDMVGYYVQGKAVEQEGTAGTAQKAVIDKKVPRRLYVMPNQIGKHDAKHRYSKFKGSHFDDPTIETILKATGLLDKDGALVR